MSAFVVSRKHLTEIAAFASSGESSPHNREQRFRHVYETLATANVASVCARYQDEKPEDYIPFTKAYYGAVAKCSVAAVEVLKLLDCLEYQSCERDDWETSEAHKLLDYIRAAAISALPGYEEAAWAID
jgi:hypothetical protein